MQIESCLILPDKSDRPNLVHFSEPPGVIWSVLNKLRSISIYNNRTRPDCSASCPTNLPGCIYLPRIPETSDGQVIYLIVPHQPAIFYLPWYKIHIGPVHNRLESHLHNKPAGLYCG